MASENIINVTDSDFEDKVLQSDRPVLVDFWAEWCAPCKSIEPYLAELADQYKDKIKIAKLDIDRNRVCASQYDIRSMPTFIMFKNGQQTNLLTGVSPGRIKEMVDKV